MAYRGAGNFSRGYALMEFILAEPHHTLKLAAKEFKISEPTARNDIYRVGLDAKQGLCRNPEKAWKMFKATLKKLKQNQARVKS